MKSRKNSSKLFIQQIRIAMDCANEMQKANRDSMSLLFTGYIMPQKVDCR